jgi:hypothetical protein
MEFTVSLLSTAFGQRQPVPALNWRLLALNRPDQAHPW